MEQLLVYAYLLDANLISTSGYVEHINTLFEEAPDNDFLLELQWSTSDTKRTTHLIFSRAENHEINYDVFGEFLMEGLKEAFSQCKSLEIYCSKIISIWGRLPKEIIQTEPFWAMSYAGEPLTWGDAKQTCEILEKMFNHYRAEEEGG